MNTPSVATRVAWNQNLINNLKTYTGAITNKAVTEHMARKLSGSSLKLEDLAKVVKLNGLAGFEELICGHQDGKARITKTKAVVKKLFNYINKEYLKVPQNIFLNNNFYVSD